MALCKHKGESGGLRLMVDGTFMAAESRNARGKFDLYKFLFLPFRKPWQRRSEDHRINHQSKHWLNASRPGQNWYAL